MNRKLKRIKNCLEVLQSEVSGLRASGTIERDRTGPKPANVPEPKEADDCLIISNDVSWEDFENLRLDVRNAGLRMMPSPHDRERRKKFKQVLKRRRKEVIARKEAQWARLRQEEAQRDAWARSLVRKQEREAEEAQRESERQKEMARIADLRELERLDREILEQSREVERLRRQAHVESLPQDPLPQRRQRYESLGINIKKIPKQSRCILSDL
ncbi:hypothetical protein QAD02_004119 [Eretmocerus hayati]|uniref:Uncharacterized protein n=1 Tax=Eretmocerus hayati TaxID=131215 RepID=A0ACC2NRA8_9HYME|nr:hypothetical protein QAD02_004119 [Eretmocerus hayati]